MPALPTLVIVTGPMGTGKTTLAHAIARTIGCPAICRDEIKEGMVHATPEFVAGPGDELTVRTFGVFFGILELLLTAGVTTVAEAAFQDQAWRRGLQPVRKLARLRVVHCVVPAAVAFERSMRRKQDDALRAAHADPKAGDAADHRARHESFERLSLAVPALEVQTADGYRPDFSEIVAFVNAEPCPSDVS